MNQLIEETIQEIQEEIKEKQYQLNLIKSIDWDQPVDEDTWHQICETSLRSSDLLGILVKNTFPNAKNIEVGCNYIFFSLHGFMCGIPTSRTHEIYVETRWYTKDRGEPNRNENNQCQQMRKYFQAKDNNENWEPLFDALYLSNHFEHLPDQKMPKRWVKFILWFGYYRWKNDHRDKWENIFEMHQKHYEEKLNFYYHTRKTMHENAKIMMEQVVPELKTFSENIHKFPGEPFDLYEIAKLEKLQGGE